MWVLLIVWFFSLLAGEYCVHIAAQRDDIDILRHLVNRGADINARVSKTRKIYL